MAKDSVIDQPGTGSHRSSSGSSRE